MSSAYLSRLKCLSQGVPFLQPDDFPALIGFYNLGADRSEGSEAKNAYEREVARLRETRVIGDGDAVLEALTSGQPVPESLSADPDYLEEFMNWGATGRFVAIGRSTLTGDHEFLARYLWRRSRYDAETGALVFGPERLTSLSFFLRDHLVPDHQILLEMAVWNDPAGRIDVMRLRAESEPSFDETGVYPSIDDDGPAPPRRPTETVLSPLTLDEALFAWGSMETIHEFRRQQATGPSMDLKDEGGIPQPRSKTCFYLFDVYEKLQEELRTQLLAERLVGSGFDGASGIRSRRQDIPAERWSEFRLDCRRSRALGDGLVISNIKIREADGTEHKTRSDDRVSMAALRSSYKKRVVELKDSGMTASEADDWAWAKETFGDRVSRRMVRELRAEIVPEEFKRRGRKATT